MAKNTKNRWFEYSTVRLSISIICVIAAWIVLNRSAIPRSLHYMLLWDVFAFVALLLDWYLIYRHSRQRAEKLIVKEDGNRLFVSTLVVVLIFGSLLFVFTLLFGKDINLAYRKPVLGIALFGILCSWFLLHTVFTLHYIHKYYQLKSKGINALTFSNTKEEPEYRDFIYSAFIVGCTFQVADFATNDKSMRQLVLLHSLLSFWLNTFVIALTINLIAGI